MVKADGMRARFGLVGKDIAYSFSSSYFTDKFRELELQNYSYENFDLNSIGEFPGLLSAFPDLKGLNVTIPYKESIVPYMDDLDAKALEIGAVNTIKFTSGGLIGHNTDAFGFREALQPLLKPDDKNALILGTGGASKAVAYVMSELNIKFRYVSRKPGAGQLHYTDLDQELMAMHSLIVNCTPLGTSPQTEQKPPIPYDLLGKQHYLFDLIYNPSKTSFLKEGELRGARIVNGLRMLELQAEKAWEIWNS